MLLRLLKRIGYFAAATILTSCSKDGAPSAQRVGATELFAYAQNSRVTTIDEFLAVLPPELRSRYVLVYDSKSVQKASFDRPRALVYSQDSKLVFSFGGDPDFDGYSTIEILEFLENEEAFQLREIYFPAEDKVSSAPAEGPRLSEINPDKCLACHGTPPRPNWEPYPTWTGSYGSDYNLLLPGQTEAERLRKFTSSANSLPRYRQLVDVANFGMTHRQRESLGLGKKPADAADNFMVKRPNSELNEQLVILNARRVAKQLRRDTRYGEARISLFAILMGCDSLERLVPGSSLDRLDAFLGFLPTRIKVEHDELIKKIDSGEKTTKEFETHDRHNTLVEKLLFVNQTFQLPIGNWSMQFRLRADSRLDFRGPAIEDGLEQILRVMAKNDPLLSGYDLSSGDRQREEICASLASMQSRGR